MQNLVILSRIMDLLMKRFLPALSAFFFFSVWMTAQPNPDPGPGWPESPYPTQAGSRWWWHGSAVTPAQLDASMRDYAAHGIGTLEITPIYGVTGGEKEDIPFLSPAWMEVLRQTQEAGRKYGIQIDMNCGTGWPFGGPQVPLEDATCKVLPVEREVTAGRGKVSFDILPPGKERPYAVLQKVMAYPVSVPGFKGRCLDLTGSARDGMVTCKLPQGSWQIIALYYSRTLERVKRAAPGGEGWVIDHFNPAAVDRYLARFEDAFARDNIPYPATFFNDSYEVYKADWTPALLEEFAVRRGYRLEEYLPGLFHGTGPDAEKVLIDYRETLSDLLLENFTGRWVAWCHRHGVRVRNQAHGSPANLIDQYAEVDIPEIEGFGLSEFGIRGLRSDAGKTRLNYSDLSMLKYASSAAHICGKPLTSSETFTWLTEHFRTSLSQLKPDMDLMFCGGVNRMFFHGTCYSPDGDPWPGRKFYASIDMSPTNTIWRDAPAFMAYVDRCQRFLQWGEPDNDFLVYLPVRDMWARRDKRLLMMFEISNMKQNAPDFIRSVLQVDSLGYDCDYISDKYLMGTTFENGMLRTAAGTRYKALILPNVQRFSPATLSHIRELEAAGATVIWNLDEQAMRRAARGEEMKSRLGLHAIRRSHEGGYHYFIANLSPEDVDAYVSLAVPFTAARVFDPMSGKQYAAEVKDGKVRLALRSGESLILQTDDNAPQAVSGPFRPRFAGSRKIDLGGNKWTLDFTEEAPRVGRSYHLDGLRTWEGLDSLTAVTMGTGVYSTAVELSDADVRRRWAIDLGDVRESARVYVNGRYVGCAWAVPFELECGDVFRPGRNEIRIEVTNLPANRIADMDRKKVPWRRFKDINVVDIHYKHTTYDRWEPVPSGLASTVCLVSLD